jgi:hypothetical protein
MNVFILCTGRCGSTTFIEACHHITNFTAEHESRARMIGAERLNYPDRHIEADNRLSWFLGRLDQRYGDSAFYVHLKRDDLKTARSLLNRYDAGIMRAYQAGILMRKDAHHEPLDVCLDYCETVNANIAAFLKDKSQTLTMTLEQAKDGFLEFWQRIGAQGNRDAALNEWDVCYNASDSSLIGRAVRAVKSLPALARSA